jgi:hypothetical protein
VFLGFANRYHPPIRELPFFALIDKILAMFWQHTADLLTGRSINI